MLTDTQKIVLSLVVGNTRPIDVARILNVSKGNVCDHLTKIYRKLGILNGERAWKLEKLRLKAQKDFEIKQMCLEGEQLLIARNIMKRKDNHETPTRLH